MPTVVNLDRFVDAYIKAALWSSTDDEEQPLNVNYDKDDIHSDSLNTMTADCVAFVMSDAGSLINEELYVGHLDDNHVDEMAGHDFWLTRNGHGSGFWDGDWDKRCGEFMAKTAKAFGESDLYVGDDGKLHITPHHPSSAKLPSSGE